MTQATLRDVHFSTKFLASVAQLDSALDFLVCVADRIRLTEVSPHRFGPGLIAWADKHDFYLYHPTEPGANECAILSRYPITAKAAYKATRLGLKIGRKQPTWVVAARTKGWGWAPVLHTPAHTGGLRTTGRFAWATKVYRSVMHGIGRIQVKLGRRQTWSMDANLDVTRDKNRQVIEKALPGMTVCAPKNQEPTEGGRVIDIHATNITCPGRSGRSSTTTRSSRSCTSRSGRAARSELS
jgi:hypothetical protein